MMIASRPPIPCQLITGPLGVGKTTTILQYLREQAGRQFVAVLVNDFGPTGLDDAILQGDIEARVRQGTELVMVPGGCICCSAAPGMLAAFQKITQMPRLDRILIEPSGMALTGDMLDLLHSLRRTYPLELRPTLTLLDVRDVDRQAYQRMPYFYRMFEAADILVGHRADLATPEQIEHFQDWATSLYPPKLRILTTHHGQLPAELFDLRLSREKSSPQEALVPHVCVNVNQMFTPAPGHDAPIQRLQVLGGIRGIQPAPSFRHTGHADGVCWDASLTFDCQGMLELLHQLVQRGFRGVPIERLKGVLHTDEGWQLLEIARGDVFSRPTDYRRDNRVDWITLQGSVDAAAFKTHLLSMTRPPVY